jgi:hypothetical protein
LFKEQSTVVPLFAPVHFHKYLVLVSGTSLAILFAPQVLLIVPQTPIIGFSTHAPVAEHFFGVAGLRHESVQLTVLADNPQVVGHEPQDNIPVGVQVVSLQVTVVPFLEQPVQGITES